MLPIRSVADTVAYMMRPEAHPAYAAARDILRRYLCDDVVGIIRSYFTYVPQRVHTRPHFNMARLPPETVLPPGLRMYIYDDLLVIIWSARIMIYDHNGDRKDMWIIPGDPIDEWCYVGHGYLLARRGNDHLRGTSTYAHTLHIDRAGTIRELDWLPPPSLWMAHVLPCGLVLARVTDEEYVEHILLLDWRVVPPRIGHVESFRPGWTCNDFGEDNYMDGTPNKIFPKYLLCKFHTAEAWSM